MNIGGPRFRIFGGPRGAKLFAGCKLIGAPTPSQCQIITFLTLKTDNIAKLRIDLKSLLLEIPLNEIKGTYNIAKLRIYLKSILLEIPLNEIKGTYIKLVY